MGGWAKTNGSGVAIAQENKLIVDYSSGGISITSANSFIGGVAAGNHGATAKDNIFEFTGESSKTDISHNGNYGALVFVGELNKSNGADGSFLAEGNKLEMSNFSVSGDASTTAQKTFIGGHVYALGLTSNNNIEELRAQGNTVDLSNFIIGKPTETAAPKVGNIAANYVTIDETETDAVELVVANGSGDIGVTLNKGEIYGATVYGGFAQNKSDGSATASNNTVEITDTSFHNTSGASTTVSNAIYGGYAETTITSNGKKIELIASNNTVKLDNSTVNSNSVTPREVEGTIRGAELKITEKSTATNLVGTTLTANNNKITVGKGIVVSNGSIQGVYLGTGNDSGGSPTIASGGAKLQANDNTVTVDGNWIASTGANIATVIGETGLLNAQNNKLVITGKVEGQGQDALVAAVVATEQDPIKSANDFEDPIHNLSNNLNFPHPFRLALVCCIYLVIANISFLLVK